MGTVATGERRQAAALEAAAAALAAGRLVAAEEVCRRALEDDPGHPGALRLRGEARLRAGRGWDAGDDLWQVLEREPDDASTWLLLGAAAGTCGDAGAAETAYRRALALAPERPEAHYNLGQLLADRRPLEAEEHLDEAVRLRPQWAEAVNARGVLLLRQKRWSEAREAFQAARRAAPGWPVPALNLGEADLGRGAPRQALRALDAAVTLAPSLARAHRDRAYALLQLGDLAAGWAEHEWRFDASGRTPPRPGYDAPVWDGSPFPGRTLVVWQEQGLGDAIQFVRFLPRVAERGGRVRLQAAPQLARLLEGCHGVDSVVVDDPPPAAVDLQIPLLSLPGRLGIGFDDLPGPVPYLRSPAALPDRLEAALGERGPRPRVGLVWRSGTLDPDGARRDLDAVALSRLLAVPGVRWFALQHGETLASRMGAAAAAVTELGAAVGDFASTAAVVARLDLVVTVDTAMAHLAGGLGVETRVLLPHPADWRWLVDRDDSPWYPTVRLYRQRSPGSWREPASRLARELTARAGA